MSNDNKTPEREDYHTTWAKSEQGVEDPKRKSVPDRARALLKKIMKEEYALANEEFQLAILNIVEQKLLEKKKIVASNMFETKDNLEQNPNMFDREDPLKSQRNKEEGRKMSLVMDYGRSNPKAEGLEKLNAQYRAYKKAASKARAAAKRAAAKKD